MPMGIVNDNDFDKELGNLTPLPHVDSTKEPRVEGTIVDMTKGRGQGSVEVPDGLRKLIGQESVTNGRSSALAIANQFGISPSSVSAYTEGARSTATIDTKPNISVINDAKLRVQSKARNRLMTALNSLTKEKIESARARDISSIAKDMSAVIRNMEPEKAQNPLGAGGPTFVFYSPQVRHEEVFEVIHVKE